MPNIFEYHRESEFVKDVISTIIDFIELKLEEQEFVSIALSGGTTPIPIYQALAKQQRLKWDKIELFMTDERYVPNDSDASNFNMIEKNLLSLLPPIHAFRPFNTQLSPEKSAEEYDDLLEKRTPKVFDLVLLGMGEDGHIASLFPHSSILNEKIKLATHSHSADGLKRLTLTLPAILSSEKIIFMMRGKQKKKKVEELLDEKVSEKDFPAKMVLSRHSSIDIFLLTEENS